MLRSSVLGASLVAWAILLGVQTLQADDATPYPPSPGMRSASPVMSPRPARAQIRVVESRFSSAKSTLYFTIAGAVTRSGVFSTDEQQIPLATLLKAAGGITDQGPVAIRIYSPQLRARAQLYYSGQTEETVRAGELVVVMRGASTNGRTTAAAPEVIPVICVGLLDRPVVLPLHPDIANEPTLVQQLMQPHEVLSSLQRLDPVGGGSSRDLISGSILVFDPAKLNQVGLQSAQELPPSVALADALKLSAPEKEVPPAEKDPTETSAVTILPSPVDVPQLLTDIEAPVQQPAVPEMAVRNFGPIVGLEAPMAAPPVASVPSPMPLPGAKVVVLPDSNIAVPEFDGYPGLPAPVTEKPASLELVSATPIVPASSIGVVESPANPTIEPDPALATPEPKPSKSATGPVASAVNDSTTADATVETLPVIESESDVAGESLTVPHAALADSRTGGVTTIALGVAVLMVLCLGVCIVWSHYDNLAFQKEHAFCGAVAPAGESKRTGEATSARSRLDDVIEQRMPVIEEEAQVPSTVQIHGRAIGHRRLALHAPHETLAGPHFNTEIRSGRNNKRSAAVQMETQLRRQLRAALQRVDQPAPAASQPAVYDVVEVEHAGHQHDLVREPAGGSLDRALRSISREKQS